MHPFSHECFQSPKLHPITICISCFTASSSSFPVHVMRCSFPNISLNEILHCGGKAALFIHLGRDQESPKKGTSQRIALVVHLIYTVVFLWNRLYSWLETRAISTRIFLVEVCKLGQGWMWAWELNKGRLGAEFRF